MNRSNTQAWIHSPGLDLSLIIAPAFITSILVLLFRFSNENASLPFWTWVVLILGVDVAHVYSSLFRTYLNPLDRQQYKTILIVVPVLCWILGVALYSAGFMLFWQVLAYIAVFHFARQQYGFMAIYSRREPNSYKQFRWIDTCLIYLCMLYPLAFWHTHLPRNFNWFIEGDFKNLLPNYIDEVCLCFLLLGVIIYFCKELILSLKTRYFSLPKNLVIVGTAFSWIVGIVVLNNDLAFTATNVLAHGIPYMVLVWLYGKRLKPKETHSYNLKVLFSAIGLPLFLILLWSLAYIEEGLWAGLIWREHLNFFLGFNKLPALSDSEVLVWLVPLLALPQVTHYVLDAFIWRFNPKAKGQNWSKVLFVEK
jgi:hypothetical protein